MWTASDSTNNLVETCLAYRPVGTLVWTEVCDNSAVQLNSVTMMIPGAAMTAAGIEYYLTATDNHGVTTYNGTPDDPHVILPCGPCPELTLLGYRTVDWTDPLWEVQVEVHNGGPGIAKDVNITMQTDIPWLIIPDPNCAYGDIPDGGSSWGLDSYTFDLTNHPGGSFNVWFDVTFEDEFGNPCELTLDPEFDPSSPSAISETPSSAYSLSQNYPNPFNPVTEISFQIPTDGAVSLEVYDVSGRLVRTLVNGHRTSGPYTERWDGKDDNGRSVATGVYFYRMKAGSFNQTRRMVLLK
jgi:hypothetical protein